MTLFPTQQDIQDMASEERKAANAKIEQENLFNSYGAEEQQAETDAFQCSRCKQVLTYFIFLIDNLNLTPPQRKCRYRQAQTRSADEPMTVSYFNVYPAGTSLLIHLLLRPSLRAYISRIYKMLL